MGICRIIASALALSVLGGALYIAYVRFHLMKVNHTREHNSASDHQSTLQMTLEGFDVISRNKPLIDGFRDRMYARVAASDPPLKGKVVLLTGATKGLGRGMAAHMAAFGATLVLPCRRCNFAELKQQVRDDAEAMFAKFGKSNKPLVVVEPHVFDADFADLDTLEAFVEWFATESGVPAADLLINNAGMISVGMTKTKQGFESTFGVNFLAPAFLTERLLERKLIKGKIVSVSSEDHRESRTNAQVLAEEKIRFGQAWGSGLPDVLLRYAYSKLLETTYFLALSRRVPNPVIDLCPGPIASDIPSNTAWPINVIAKTSMALLFPDIYTAAIPVLRLALDEEFAKVSGVHFHIAEERPAREDARNQKVQDDIYAKTLDLIRNRKAPA